MKNYQLTCCSTADLTKEQFHSRDIGVVFFHFELDGTFYDDDMGMSVSPEELFRRMEAGAETKTSQVSVGEYIAFWEAYLKEGLDILHVTLSTGLSGTYQSAVLARDQLLEEYPERRIYIVDSLGASSGYGLLMDTLADKRDEGYSIEDLYQWALDNRLRMHHWFFSMDLTFYIRGGRIPKAAGMIGTALKICPLLNMDHEGHLTPRLKIRTKKKTMKRVLEIMEEHAQDHLDYHGKCYLCHSICLEDAQTMAAMIEEHFPHLNGRVAIYPIGATIGSHTGPGTISVFFWGDLRTD